MLSRVFAALASPVRLLLLRAMVAEPRNSQQLRELLDAGSAGQLYHHLRELLAAGLVTQPGRSVYAIPREKVVAICVALTAAVHLMPNALRVPLPPNVPGLGEPGLAEPGLAETGQVRRCLTSHPAASRNRDQPHAHRRAERTFMLTRYPGLASRAVPAGLAAVRFNGPHGPVMPVVVAAAVLIIAAVV